MSWDNIFKDESNYSQQEIISILQQSSEEYNCCLNPPTFNEIKDIVDRYLKDKIDFHERVNLSGDLYKRIKEGK